MTYGVRLRPSAPAAWNLSTTGFKYSMPLKPKRQSWNSSAWIWCPKPGAHSSFYNRRYTSPSCSGRATSRARRTPSSPRNFFSDFLLLASGQIALLYRCDIPAKTSIAELLRGAPARRRRIQQKIQTDAKHNKKELLEAVYRKTMDEVDRHQMSPPMSELEVEARHGKHFNIVQRYGIEQGF